MIPSILPSQSVSDNRADDHLAGKTEQSKPAAEPSAESPKRSNPTASAVQSASAELRKKAAAGTQQQLKNKTPAPSSAEPSNAGDVKDPVSRRGPIQAQEVATGMGGLQSGGDSFGFGPPIGGSPRPGFFLPERFLSPIAEPNADVEFIVRRRETQRQDTIARNETARQSAETDIAPAIAKQSPTTPSSSNLSANFREIRWFSVPADQYDQFRKDLAAEASIDSEKAIGPSEREFAQKLNRELLIKVIIVSPAER